MRWTKLMLFCTLLLLIVCCYSLFRQLEGNATNPTHITLYSEMHLTRNATDNNNIMIKLKASDELKARLHFLEAAVNHSYAIGNPATRDIINQSMNADIIARGSFQNIRVYEFCSRYRNNPSLPAYNRKMLESLIYDDTAKVVLCPVPKIGCSNMAQMMVILNGRWPAPKEGELQKRPSPKDLWNVNRLSQLTDEEVWYRLEHYTKAVIIRNPFERLLSAFRNKLESPYNATSGLHYDKVKRNILKSTRSNLKEQLKQNKRLQLTFHEYIKYITEAYLPEIDLHFRPLVYVCHPCLFQYDFYGNFKSIKYDFFALMDHVNIPFSYYPDYMVSHPTTPTETLMDKYYSTVDTQLMQKLINSRFFALEMEFYYSLYPEEWDMHQRFM